ncbi:hypothetical protein AC249_AIPGENE20061 [Exaiptasia diaphana]|nr:hypothetical protein AC249_AIPGENE20061 [Exaiptasia diaphana]
MEKGLKFTIAKKVLDQHVPKVAKAKVTKPKAKQENAHPKAKQQTAQKRAIWRGAWDKKWRKRYLAKKRRLARRRRRLRLRRRKYRSRRSRWAARRRRRRNLRLRGVRRLPVRGCGAAQTVHVPGHGHISVTGTKGKLSLHGLCMAKGGNRGDLKLKSVCLKVNPFVEKSFLRRNRGYYMGARRYGFYLRVLKRSLTSERSERVRDFQHEKIKFSLIKEDECSSGTMVNFDVSSLSAVVADSTIISTLANAGLL